MKHMRLLASSFGLVLGCAILGISLSAGNTMVQSAGTPYETSKKQFYVDDAVLPDHVAYPVLMAIDRAKLEMDSPEERVYTQVAYAQRRFEYAQALIDKNNKGLALSTITKAEKYLINAAHEALALEHGDNQLRFVSKSLLYYHDYLESVKQSFPDSDRTVIDHLQQEIGTLQLQLQALL
jgi:hypothetical protein